MAGARSNNLRGRSLIEFKVNEYEGKFSTLPAIFKKIAWK